LTREQPYHRLYRWSPQPQAHYARAGTKNPWIAELTGEEWNIAYATLGEDIYEHEAPPNFLPVLRASMKRKMRHWAWPEGAALTLHEFAWQQPHVLRSVVFLKGWVDGPPPLNDLFPYGVWEGRRANWCSCLLYNQERVRNDHPATLMAISDPQEPAHVYDAAKVLEKVKSRKRKPAVRKK